MGNLSHIEIFKHWRIPYEQKTQLTSCSSFTSSFISLFSSAMIATENKTNKHKDNNKNSETKTNIRVKTEWIWTTYATSIT